MSDKETRDDRLGHAIGGMLAGLLSVMAVGMAIQSFVGHPPNLMIYGAAAWGAFAGLLWRLTQ